jgi:chromosome segregation ATPase
MASYFPKAAAEKKAYEMLWSIANPTHLAEIGGVQAVDFFRKSRLEMTQLKLIWSLSTPFATMNKFQFFCALRYITMAQTGIPVSEENLIACAEIFLEVPKFVGVGLAPLNTADDGVVPSVNYSPVAGTPTTEGKDVEVKRIIWVETDGTEPKQRSARQSHSGSPRPPASSRTSTSSRHEQQEFAMELQQRLIEEERRTRNGMTNIDRVTTEVHGLEGQLNLYKSQLENAKGAHHSVQTELSKRESEKKKLQQQVQETQLLLQQIQMQREESLRRAEETAKSELAAREIKALEDRLIRLKASLDGAKQQQVDTEALLQQRFRERENLKQQVANIQKSMSASQGDDDSAYFPTVVMASPKHGDREKQVLLEQIAEARRVLVRNDSTNADSSQEVSTLRTILADLNEDIKKKQAGLLMLSPKGSMDERMFILSKIQEARLQLSQASNDMVSTATNFDQSIDASLRRDDYSSHSLQKLKSILSDLEAEKASIRRAQVTLNRQYTDAQSQLTVEMDQLARAQEPNVDSAEKDKLIKQIVELSALNNRDSGNIRENVAKFSDLEQERVRINELLAALEANDKSAGKEVAALSSTLMELRKDSQRLEEERATMSSEKQQSQMRIEALLAELQNSQRLLAEAETRGRHAKDQIANIHKEKEALSARIVAARESVTSMTKEMGSLAVETKEYEVQCQAVGKEISSLPPTVHNQQDDRLRAEVDVLKEEFMRLEQTNIAMLTELEKMKEKLATAKESARSLSASKADRATAVQEHTNLAKQKEELTRAVNAAKEKLEAFNQQMRETTNDIESVNLHKAELANQLADVNKELTAMKTDAVNISESITTLRILKDQLEAEG